MTKRRQFWAVIIFIVLSAAPFISVIWSFAEVRSAVLFDSEIKWAEGETVEMIVPSLKPGVYELRMESADSKWNPMVNLTWGLKDKASQKNYLSFDAPYEVELMKPIAKLHLKEDALGENVLWVRFFNANPTNQSMRFKLTLDREAMLAKGSQQFLIVLAISLVLSLLIWRPLMSPVKPNS